MGKIIKIKISEFRLAKIKNKEIKPLFFRKSIVGDVTEDRRNCGSNLNNLKLGPGRQFQAPPKKTYVIFSLQFHQ